MKFKDLRNALTGKQSEAPATPEPTITPPTQTPQPGSTPPAPIPEPTPEAGQPVPPVQAPEPTPPQAEPITTSEPVSTPPAPVTQTPPVQTPASQQSETKLGAVIEDFRSTTKKSVSPPMITPAEEKPFTGLEQEQKPENKKLETGD